MGGITTINSINNSSTTIINQTGGGGVTPVSYILEWDTTNSYYKPYADKAAAGDEFSAGKLYLGIESINKPTGTQYTLNYDGYFRSTKLYAAEAEVQFVSTIQGLQFDAIAANPGTDFTLWSNNADDGRLYYGLDPVIAGLISHILEFVSDSSGNRYVPYSTKTDGCFYYGATPTGTTALSYDGYFRATKLFIGATEVISFPGFGTNHTTAAYGDHTHSYLTEAPSDGSTYGRLNGTWSAITEGATLIDNILEFVSDSAGDYYTPYAAHPGDTTMQFYLGTTNPTGTTRLNLNANLYTKGLTSNANITGIGTITSYKDGNNQVILNGDGGGVFSLVGGSYAMFLNPSVADASSQVAYIFGTMTNLTATGTKLAQFKNVSIVRANINNYGKYEFTAGTSSTFALASGILKQFTANSSAIPDNGVETDMYSYTLPANILSEDNSFLDFIFITSSSGTGMTAKFYFGGTGGIGIAPTGGVCMYRGILYRLTSSTAIMYIIVAGSIYDVINITSLNFATTNILKITGTIITGGSTFIGNKGIIYYYPAAVN
jgi:hypothetical protein